MTKQALAMGKRTIMMDRGEIILDLKGKEREKITVNDLLKVRRQNWPGNKRPDLITWLT